LRAGLELQLFRRCFREGVVSGVKPSPELNESWKFSKDPLLDRVDFACANWRERFGIAGITGGLPLAIAVALIASASKDNVRRGHHPESHAFSTLVVEWPIAMAAPAAIVTRRLVIDKNGRYLWLEVFRFALSVPFAFGFDKWERPSRLQDSRETDVPLENSPLTLAGPAVVKYSFGASVSPCRTGVHE
jgi:hypothetical protein